MGMGQDDSTATRYLWVKGEGSSSSSGTAMPGPWNVLPWACPKLSGPPDRILRPRPHGTGDTSLLSKHLCTQTVLLGPRPLPLSQGRDSPSLALPGVTPGQGKRGCRSSPLTAASHQLCGMVSEHTGAERCLVSLGSRRMERRILTNGSKLSLRNIGSSRISLSQVKVLAGPVTSL